MTLPTVLSLATSLVIACVALVWFLADTLGEDWNDSHH
jgi:hypothetical protein